MRPALSPPLGSTAAVGLTQAHVIAALALEPPLTAVQSWAFLHVVHRSPLSEVVLMREACPVAEEALLSPLPQYHRGPMAVAPHPPWQRPQTHLLQHHWLLPYTHTWLQAPAGAHLPKKF